MQAMGNIPVRSRAEQVTGIKRSQFQPIPYKSALTTVGVLVALGLAAFGLYLYVREPGMDWTPTTPKKTLPKGYWIHGSSCRHDPCKWVSIKR